MPNGALAGDYHKHYFVRGFEDGYQSGDRIYSIGAQWGKMGVAICKDLDYPWFITGYGAKNATLMLVPAWDWEGPNAVMHERMSVVRGVENGFAIARAAKTGYVTAHDAYGRTLASSSTFAEDPAMVVADIPLGPGNDALHYLGDWFGWLCYCRVAGNSRDSAGAACGILARRVKSFGVKLREASFRAPDGSRFIAMRRRARRDAPLQIESFFVAGYATEVATDHARNRADDLRAGSQAKACATNPIGTYPLALIP